MSRPYNGVPTTYRGVRMRSRLEARWAAFFDSLGWVWDYEPFDLSYWLPDFSVHFQQGDVLFEVKGPVDLFEDTKGKIQRSRWTDEVVLVGDRFTGPIIGDIVDLRPGLPGFEWDPCKAFYCISCGENSICNESGASGWRCRRCGAAEGHMGEVESLEAKWKEAGNRVQWRPSK